jgi:hypothetical protein
MDKNNLTDFLRDRSLRMSEIREEFNYVYRLAKWLVVTDGNAILAIESDTPGYKKASGKFLNLRTWLAVNPKKYQEVDVEKFRKSIFTLSDQDELNKSRPMFILGYAYDLNLLCLALKGAPEKGTIRIFLSNKTMATRDTSSFAMLHITGENWHLVSMPLNKFHDSFPEEVATLDLTDLCP